MGQIKRGANGFIRDLGHPLSLMKRLTTMSSCNPLPHTFSTETRIYPSENLHALGREESSAEGGMFEGL